MFFPKEIACCVFAGYSVKRDQPRSGVRSRTRFVKTNMSRTSNAQQLDVKPAHLFNMLFVITAIFVDALFRNGTVGDVYLFLRNVDMIEKVLIHESYITLQSIGLHGIVLIQVKGDDVLKGETFLMMHANKFIVYLCGSRAGGKSQYGTFTLVIVSTNQICNMIGHEDGAIGCSVKNFS